MNAPNKPRLLVVDDDAEMRTLLTEFFSGRGIEVETFPLATAALEHIEKDHARYEMIISDIKMPQMDGLTFVKKLRSIIPNTPIVLMTAFGSIETAIEAIRCGAYDYIVKPFKLNEVQLVVDRAIEYRNLKLENVTLRTEVKKTWSLENMIGKSQSMQAVFELVQKVAHASANVLITGESGTGKELVARAIHTLGLRSKQPFIAINCTAIPENLLESELFGHAKGSFTGAIGRKRGLFEEANGGTLFLDEIGDMDLGLQSKLLRVLQEKKIRSVGDNLARDVDVRIIAATHKDLKTAIRDGVFREDLYYRLSVIPIQIPPLRHRKEDIPILAEHFLRKYAATNESKVKGFTPAALNHLVEQKWEGNVRELENIIERVVVLASGEHIDVKDLPPMTDKTPEDFFGSATKDHPTLAQLERRYIEYIMDKTGGRKTKAAQILGINRRTLYRKEKEYDLSIAEKNRAPVPEIPMPSDVIPEAAAPTPPPEEKPHEQTH